MPHSQYDSQYFLFLSYLWQASVAFRPRPNLKEISLTSEAAGLKRLADSMTDSPGESRCIIDGWHVVGGGVGCLVGWLASWLAGSRRASDTITFWYLERADLSPVGKQPAWPLGEAEAANMRIRDKLKLGIRERAGGKQYEGGAVGFFYSGLS